MGKRGRKNFGGKGGNFAKKSRQTRDDVADAAASGGWDDAKKAGGDGFSEWIYTNDNFVRYYKVRFVLCCAPTECLALRIGWALTALCVPRRPSLVSCL